jgi:hypothetical protein
MDKTRIEKRRKTIGLKRLKNVTLFIKKKTAFETTRYVFFDVLQQRFSI